MTGRLTSEAEIREAGAARVREWREQGCRVPPRVAEQIAAILGPVRHLLYPQTADKADAEAA